MSEASLELWEQLVALHRALDEAQIPHAFGGALALAYCARPRSTDDIDVNVAVAPAELDRVLAALPAGVELTGKETTLAASDGQLRLWWGRTAIDIFFVQHPFHDDIARHARIVPFADIEIPVISGEHLVVCKAMFDRTKDWQDIDAIAHAGTGARRSGNQDSCECHIPTAGGDRHHQKPAPLKSTIGYWKTGVLPLGSPLGSPS